MTAPMSASRCARSAIRSRIFIAISKAYLLTSRQGAFSYNPHSQKIRDANASGKPDPGIKVRSKPAEKPIEARAGPNARRFSTAGGKFTLASLHASSLRAFPDALFCNDLCEPGCQVRLPAHPSVRGRCNAGAVTIARWPSLGAMSATLLAGDNSEDWHIHAIFDFYQSRIPIR